MNKRHDAIFGDVLKDIDAAAEPEDRADDRGGARFLKRANALAEAGAREEKVLRWVEPATCVMWARHNRAYDLLSEANCRDLIDSIRAQGRQEFPAIVRQLPAGRGAEYEVVCGARRHFAVSWLRANNFPQFRYLIEVRDLTDEEAFRLADVENRDREDISDYERARDYSAALDQYYGGRQAAMADRLEVSEGWLSRYLSLAKLPEDVVAAYATIRDVKELHARLLKPLLSDPASRERVLAMAATLASEQTAARAGQGTPIPAAQVVARLKAAAAGPRRPRPVDRVFRPAPEESGVTMRRKHGKVTLEFNDTLSDAALRAAFDQFFADRAARRR